VLTHHLKPGGDNARRKPLLLPRRPRPVRDIELGDFALESAVTLPSAKLAYRTFGTLSPAKDNAVLFPHMYSGTHLHMERFVAKGMALDPDKYFIVLPGQFGNGLSSSLSNTPPPFQPGRLPERDDRGRRARAQHRLIAPSLPERGCRRAVLCRAGVVNS
jgi:homoserine O-acetyltransferase/O-succinyltransferase